MTLGIAPLAALLLGAAPAQNKASTPAAPPPTKPATPPTAGNEPRPTFQHFDLNQVDKSVDPCTDFYAYACNTWIKENPIPADRGRWGTAGHLALANQYLTRDILEAAAKERAGRTAPEREIGDDYAACMDEPAINAAGAKALAPQLALINGMKSKAELPHVLAQLHLATFNLINPTDSGGFTPYFMFSAGQDLDDASIVVATVDQGGLGLPDRDYYLKDDPKSVETRNAYEAHVAKMLELSGETKDAASAQAKVILATETALAKGAMDLVKRRDPANLNHKLQLADLQKLTPSFDWKTYLAEVKMPATKHFLVEVPESLKAFDQQLASHSLDDIKAYLRWHLVHSSAGLLSEPFVQEDFAFYGQRLGGAKELMPRWKRCGRVIDRDLGEALGAVFVARAFPPSSKERMQKMVDELQKAMATDIRGLDWMGAATKKQAEVKLKAILDKIGYPEHPRDYSSIALTRKAALENAYGASAFELHRVLNKIGKPPDPSEWYMTAPTVNAYYDPQMNSINFPAGILQPPYFDPAMEDAVNYGDIGSIIGHEMTHGFDDQGSKFDAKGNLRDWWTKADGKRFAEREECIANEYSGFTVLDGSLHVNGHLTLGENTADNGGIRIAHAAWLQLAKEQKQKVTAEAERAFFLSYAEGWCSNWSDAAMRLIVQTNPHSPPHYRVNGVLRNVPEFQKAYACKTGTPMAPAKRCRVW